MKKIDLLLGIGLLCISLSSLAGEVITNDTGEDATGLRVVFSTSVQITAFGDTLTKVDQTGPADEFVFSGGTVPPWGSHWLSWTPTTARVVEYDWLTDSALPLQGLAAEQRADRPVLTGNLLNPDYFVHPAYVMQGEDARDAVFAMPLDGVEELAFYPVVDGAHLEDVTWSVEVSHPEGIGASIESRTLYIWGSNASWAGYGEVTLEAVLGDAVSSVAIPVAVLTSDKTLINAGGRKDYFVPWSPELDVNRILSVEEHMRAYNKDEGNLDRTIQWSRWKKMEFQWDIDLGSRWPKFLLYQNWPVSSQFALVDIFLAELATLGIESIRYWNDFFIPNHFASEIIPIYDGVPHLPSATKKPDEEAYIANEAHRLGLTVSLGNAVSIGNPDTGEWEELYAATPAFLQDYLSNLIELNSESLPRWQQLGIDMVDLCPGLSSMNRYNNTYKEASVLSTGIERIVTIARESFSGSIFHTAHYNANFFPNQSILLAPFWTSFDVIGISAWGIQTTSAEEPSVDQLVSGWRMLIDTYFQPFQSRYDKPFLMTEIGCLAAEGCAKWGLICDRIDGFDETKTSTEDMAKYYIAQSQAFQSMDGYRRPGWWEYPLLPYAPYSGGFRETLNGTPRLKIEDTIQEICLGFASPRVIVIDGEFDDWQSNYMVGEDPLGDAYGSADLLGLGFVDDEDYIYFKIWFESSPTQPSLLTLLMDTTGDDVADVSLFLNNIWTLHDDWCGKAFLYPNNDLTAPMLGFADSIDGDRGIEIRIAKRFFEGSLDVDSLRARLIHYSQSSTIWDETDWFDLWGQSSTQARSVFEILDCGSLATGSDDTLQGISSVQGAYSGSENFTPYLRTVPAMLPLAPRGQYEVCFDYRILEANSEGFEVLFYSPTGAGHNNWVTSLRVNVDDGQSGHACLEGTLHDYSDYEIRWNVITNGKIVIDNITVRDLETDQVIAEEDFEDWE